MKKILFSILAVGVILSGCKKDLMFDADKEPVSVSEYIAIQLYSGVEVVETEKYGTLLSFDDLETFWSIEELYKDSSAEEFSSWEKGLAFTSLRSVQWDAYQAFLEDETGDVAKPDMYLPEVAAMVLNPEGYIMFDGKVYQDVNNGRQMYEVHEDGTKTLIHNLDANTKSSCNNDVVTGGVSGYPCSGYDSYSLNVEMGFYDTWFSAYDYVYAESSQRIASCSSWGSSAAYGTLTFRSSYNVTHKNGSASAQNQIRTLTNRASGWVKIIEEKELCIDEVSVTHQASFNGSTLSTNTRID